MKGKKYTTEEKIRILRQADAGESIVKVCREHNLSEVSLT
jgi:transposase-like protein